MGALADLRVVEFGNNVSAPYCARLFADLGAEVIKVEGPGGDPSREQGPFGAGGPDPEESGIFHYLNAGKRGVVADLDDSADLEFFHGLLAGADVLVENSAPDEYKRWGLDAASLTARHPHLVVVSVSPYGRTGEWADRPGTDITAQGAASLPLALGMPDREPLRIPFEQADYQGALHAFAAALCALYARRSSGRGQGVDVSVAQVMAYCVGGMHLVGAKGGAKWGQRSTSMKGSMYPTGFFACKDGFVCIASQTPKQWEAFLSLMDNPKWSKEGQAGNAVYLGLVDSKPVDKHFKTWLMEYDRAELIEMAMAENIVMGVAQNVDEVLASEQFAFRELFGEFEVGGQAVKVPKPGYQLRRTPTELATRGPKRNADGADLRANLPEPIALEVTGAPTRALEGVRVLDFGWNWAGPMAGQLFADMGAEVIRVETSKRQDLMRFLDYTSWFFCHNNRSKMSATFNLGLPEGQELVQKLARKSDIVMDNFAAGVMAKNRLAYDDLAKENPEIIVVSMSMAGQEGPLRGMRGFASIATGYAGTELMVGYPEIDTSTGLLPFGLGDTTMAIQGVIGGLAALHHRANTGEGQFVDVSQMDSSASTLGEPMLAHQLNGDRVGPQGNGHTNFCPHGIYAAEGEERWLALAVRTDDEWQALCGVMGRDDLGSNADLAGAAQRRERAAEINEAITSWTSGLDRDAAVEQLAAAGVPTSAVLDLDERNETAHFAGRGLCYQHEFDDFDPCRIYGTPWLFSETPADVTRKTPTLGENNDYVFKELLELGDDEIARLVEESVLV
ncbi:MAG: CoA transferase [Myxococcota bacterium]|jgi:crotonobetainyl-CoA:carnitine CoA-transferase CaiB-like acyl-CoA transferase|nr:CoA transferase [Myxococcota bacterium]